jgi:methanol--5-hydroxybenzimidazolylcobamide Co-methyltransferase
MECIKIVEEGAKGKLELSRFEAKALSDAKTAFESLTDNKDKFMSDCLTKYKDEVSVFRPENYGL